MQIRMVHNGRDRDSLLMPMDDRTIDLMLQFSIQLVRVEPTTRLTEFRTWGTHGSGDGILHDGRERFNLDAWTNAEWVAFCDNFVRVLMRYWDGKFELGPNRAWYQPRHAIGAASSPKITCSMSIGLVDTAGLANQRFFIIKPQQTNFRSFAVGERRLGLFTHRDLALDWNTRRTRMGRVTHSVSFLQTTILHEFGHTLGLHHVRGRGNTDAHYGITLDQRNELMGMGDHATSRLAQPWISQLRHHLIPAHAEAPVRFTARVVAPQLITYWDNDWVPPPTPAAP
jgi:hypothetical protein